MKTMPLLVAVSPAAFTSRWANATADGIGGAPRGPPEDDIPTGWTGPSILGAEESPLSGVAELAYYHASRGAERIMTCGDLFYVRLYSQLPGTDRLTEYLVSSKCRVLLFFPPLRKHP